MSFCYINITNVLYDISIKKTTVPFLISKNILVCYLLIKTLAYAVVFWRQMYIYREFHISSLNMKMSR